MINHFALALIKSKVIGNDEIITKNERGNWDLNYGHLEPKVSELPMSYADPSLVTFPHSARAIYFSN